MKQLVQDFKTGVVQLVDVPPPAVGAGLVLVQNAFSLVSAGTERATVSLGKKSLLGKARARPDLVKQVLQTVRREGLGATMRKVQSKLDSWKELGYSTAGTVIEVGEGVTGFAPGDRVACGGQDYASHAEIVAVPQNLCARMPDGVEFSHAAFTTVGAIALQGVRQADVRLGETVAVMGLGLIGQITVQILRAAGCQVLGLDVDASACARGMESGATGTAVIGGTGPSPLAVASTLTREFGVDAVIITASAPTNEPLVLAAQISRDRGRVVMVGVTGMEIPRDLYFKKEIEFRLSRSYGPGRYDPSYEEHGIDYPIGYVRWTEQRNFEAFLGLIGDGKLDLGALVTHTFPVEKAPEAFNLITDPGEERVVAVLIEYPAGRPPAGGSRVTVNATAGTGELSLGVVGAGSYAQGVLLPRFQAAAGVRLRGVCTHKGVTARKAAEKFGFETATTDWRELVADDAVNTVLVATRHDLHAPIVVAALKAGKTVFCEKPLCLREEELDEILAVIDETGNDRVMVGFNRRFAPWAAPLRELAHPVVLRYRVNAGPLPRDHWTKDPVVGGGRIVGEVCHFVDFLQYAARSRPVAVYGHGFGEDNVQVSIRFADGSVGAVDYFAVGDPAMEKEYVEAFGGGRHAVADGIKDKGQAEQVKQFVAAVTAGDPLPIPLDEIVASTRATFAVLRSMETGAAVRM